MRTLAAPILAAVAMSSCGAPPDIGATQDRLLKAEERIDSLAKDLAALQVESFRLQGELNKKATWSPEALLQLGADEFVAVDSWIGPITLQVTDVAALGAGTRISLRVGNPNNATLRSVHLDLEYGGPRPGVEKPDDLVAWAKALKRRRHTLTEPVQAGAWNDIRITLPDVPAQQLGYLLIRPSFDQIALKTPN